MVRGRLHEESDLNNDKQNNGESMQVQKVKV
jgi:hypothetical protein